MTKKSGLGRGLGALISDDSMHSIEKNINEHGELVQEIDVNLIIPNKDQPRKHFDSEKISALGDSIEEHGLLQPIVLKRSGSYYEIIAGERRWRATKSIGRKKIQAIIRDVDEFTIAQLALIENVQREDLNPIEEALAYMKLIEEYKITQEKLSKIVGKSRSYLTNTMRLVKLEPIIQESIMKGTLSNGHGRALLSIEDTNHRIMAFEKIINEGLSVRVAEDMSRNFSKYFKTKTQQTKTTQKLKEITSLENELSLTYGTKVTINENNGKGRISIDFYNIDDLNRIIDLIR
ncbi:ParB/RepB/Spo0J family partition protein [Fusibacter tunisiensis]|uniref:ParB family chromosome partitioning protein n=1 Tax=Fusibacter tunisiensis TaxID=1008308 RepID=A0ABS2MNM6_9FIRM|nr:ParB/RepB/Spo0J family partition protein [Fusibacter tunisiensis]MBM7560995.1 ParB family chromosome partitioning protein [Fusibacter tunisiensis]